MGKCFFDYITSRKWAGRIFWLCIFLIVWYLSCRVSHVSPMLLPSPADVWETITYGIFHGDLLWQTAYSLWIIAWSLFLSAVLAVILALVSRQNRLVNSFTDTLTALAHPLPGLALLPLIIMWFGTGTGAVTAIVVHSALWPVFVNLTAGFDAMPAIYEDIGRSLSMSQTAITLEIRLRASLGYLISGLRIGWARGWRAFISAEMVFGAVGAKGGIGWYILTQRTFMNTAGLFAGIILVILIGVLVEDGLFAAIERHTLAKWGMKSV